MLRSGSLRCVSQEVAVAADHGEVDRLVLQTLHRRSVSRSVSLLLRGMITARILFANLSTGSRS